MISGPPRQNSCNVVGYVDVSVPAGDALIANPLSAADNRVVALFPGVPDGTAVYKYGPTGWTANTFDLGEWSDPNMTVTPGEGILFRNPPGGPAGLTFVGQVVQGYGANPVDNGWTLRSSIIPQAGRVTTDLLFPVLQGDKVRRMVGGSYVEYTYGSNGWTPSEPQVSVGESFFSYKNVGFYWSRNFLVWP